MAGKRLTAAQIRLLEYPPSPTTWECQARKKDAEGTWSYCFMVNAGSRADCTLCRTPKGRKPKLLWDQYTAACRKVGIDPDKRERYVHASLGIGIRRTRASTRRPAKRAKRVTRSKSNSTR